MNKDLSISADEMVWQNRIFDSLSYPSVIISPDKTLVGANKKFYEAFNLSFNEIFGKKCYHTFLYKDTPCNSDQCTISKVIKDKKSHSFTLKHHYRWEERVFSPILDDNGDVAYVIGSIRDITRTKSLEGQLHGVKEFISRVIHSSASAIIAADRQGNINLMNSVAKELFGDYNGGEGKIKHTEQLYPPGKAKEIMGMLRNEKIGGVGKLLIPRTTIVNAHGKNIEVEMSAAIIYDEKGNESATMAIYNDLKDKIKIENELKMTQKQLSQSEKMASLGQLAAGVAHEINNPLTGILFYASLLLERKDIDESMVEDLGYILEDANRCKEIVKSLLVYSRSQGTKKNIVQLNDIVQQSLALIRDQKKFRNIKIKKALSDEMMLINADTSKLNQVLINLVINAADAMNGSGTITLTTYKEKAIGKVFLEIKDKGEGIPHENLSKIFDPFFTTKDVGKSTGLGLSIVYGLIEEHEAKISVKKTGSQGTTFIIEFPMYVASKDGLSLCKPYC
ncbi:ATP-binding protein [Desulfobacula sp.]|uniref:PAS domain-containing sensor histidine kinase n=1 Tax=Desulfobacula sp. TaxID=2593537 RepID=UPI0039B98CDE|nr:PAS domain S-box protein [Desulfobacula sp.]